MLQLTTIIFLISFFTLAVIHNIAIQLFLYWRIWWLDIPVHAFGGVIVALGFFALRDLRLFPDSLLKPFPILLFVLLIVIAWEVYEILIGIPVYENYVIDTAIDMIVGMLGGYVGYIVGSNVRQLQ